MGCAVGNDLRFCLDWRLGPREKKIEERLPFTPPLRDNTRYLRSVVASVRFKAPLQEALSVRCFLLALGRETMAGMESIYSLIPQPVPPVIKPDRYHSKHPGNKPPTFSTFGLTGTSKPGYQNVAGAESSLKEGHHVFQKGHATMGKEGNARKPADILKKGTGGGGGAADLAGASTGGGAQGQQTFSLHTLFAWRARASAQSSRAGGRRMRGGGIAACAVAADPPDAHASHERTLRGCWAPLPLQTALHLC